jgi:hypothetical protein
MLESIRPRFFQISVQLIRNGLIISSSWVPIRWASGMHTVLGISASINYAHYSRIISLSRRVVHPVLVNATTQSHPKEHQSSNTILRRSYVQPNMTLYHEGFAEE